MNKQCSICHEVKPLKDFSPLNKGRDGRYPYCRSCHNAQIRKKRTDENNSYIYVLVDPLSLVVCYVGYTKQPLHRLKGHINHALSNKRYYKGAGRGKVDWIIGLLDVGEKPIFEVIEVCNPSVTLVREAYWINHYKSINPNLFNVIIPKKYNAVISHEQK